MAAALLVALAGCGDSITFDDVVSLDLSDPIWAAKYAAMEECSGGEGDFSQAHWYGIPRAAIEGWAHWKPPHDVFIFGRGNGAEINSFHEGALRHILRTNSIPAAVLQTCDVPEREL